MQTLAVIFLALIAVAEFVRLYLTHRKPTKRDHYKAKLHGVRQMIWDLEFKMFKTKEIREEVRQTYDQNKSRLYIIEAQLKDWPADKPVEEKPALEDAKVLIVRDNERYEKQMAALDVEMNGSKKTNDYPDGYDGIAQQLDSLQELKGMIEDWLKAL